jgi:hypothetical protein
MYRQAYLSAFRAGESPAWPKVHMNVQFARSSVKYDFINVHWLFYSKCCAE